MLRRVLCFGMAQGRYIVPRYTSTSRGSLLPEKDAILPLEEVREHMSDGISDRDLQTLAAIRRELRVFLQFSEGEARAKGLTPQQHQAMLSIAGAQNQELTVGDLAMALLLKPHSASGLVSRLEMLGMVERSGTDEDARRRVIRLSGLGSARIEELSKAHRGELRRLRTLLVKLLNSL